MLSPEMEARVARLLTQRCSNSLVSRITGLDYKTVARVRKRLATILNQHRAKTLKATRGVPCPKCGDIVRYPKPEWHGLCKACREPPTRLSERPTDTQPGSEARMAVYAARILAKEVLFHPADDNMPRPFGLDLPVT